MLKKAFAMFDQGKTGFIETNRVAAILNTMGQQFDSNELAITIEETDKDSKAKLLTISGTEHVTNYFCNSSK